MEAKAAQLLKPTVEVKSQPSSNKANVSDVLISVIPPATTKRLPLDVVCVIDNSGSMGSSASIKTEDGKEESHGLNLLNIVVHGVKTIITALEPEDRLGIVTFESQVVVLRELSPLGNDKIELSSLDTKLDALRPMGSTSLWGGLTKGIEQLTKYKSAGRVTSLVLLTDGEPTDLQPDGIVSSLAQLKSGSVYNNQLPTLNCFGFGYSMNSNMLLKIAQIGNGSYSFIPDAGFVGTTFVNCTANNLCMYSPVVTVDIKPVNKTKLITSTLPAAKAGGYVNIELQSLQFDQTRDFALQVQMDPNLGKDEPYLEVVVSYEVFGQKTNSVEKIQVKATDREGSPRIAEHVARWAVIDAVQDALDNYLSGKETKVQFAELLPQVPESLAIHKDLTGQITEAFKKDEYFVKWGKHYLPSLLRAHRLQQCNNFKDPGIQEYGGKMFSGIRDVLDDKFLSIPPPKPRGRYGNSYSSTPVSYNMSSYYSSSAPCFTGECKVQKWSESKNKFETELLKNLKRGDVVIGDNGKSVKIECVLKTNSSSGDGTFDLVELESGLIVTPWHPVRENTTTEGSEWKFPAEIGQVKNRPCEAVYSFVLEAGKTLMEINNWQCVSLGHGRKDDKVVEHEYFGTERVVEDLRKMKGWRTGKIEMKQGGMVRGADGLVCGLNVDMEQVAQVSVPDN